MISIMTPLSLMCASRRNCKAHVDALGLHWQSAQHPCTNCTTIFTGSPQGGMRFVPVANSVTWPGVNVAFSEDKNKTYIIYCIISLILENLKHISILYLPMLKISSVAFMKALWQSNSIMYLKSAPSLYSLPQDNPRNLHVTKRSNYLFSL